MTATTQTLTSPATAPSAGGVLPSNQQAARTWGAGGQAYDRISRQIADVLT